jgi:hypothetical protein
VVPRKIDLGEGLAALGALLVLIALFLEWFSDATAWEAFEALDLALSLLALTVLAAALGAFDWLGARMLLPLGALLLFVIVVQLVEPPPVVPDDDPGAGAWLALAGAGLVLLGGALRTASISVTVSVGGKETRRRVAAVDRRQAAAAPPAPAAPDAPAATPTSAPTPPLDEPTQATQPFSALDEEK